MVGVAARGSWCREGVQRAVMLRTLDGADGHVEERKDGQEDGGLV